MKAVRSTAVCAWNMVVNYILWRAGHVRSVRHQREASSRQICATRAPVYALHTNKKQTLEAGTFPSSFMIPTFGKHLRSTCDGLCVVSVNIRAVLENWLLSYLLVIRLQILTLFPTCMATGFVQAYLCVQIRYTDWYLCLYFIVWPSWILDYLSIIGA